MALKYMLGNRAWSFLLAKSSKIFYTVGVNF